MNYYEEDFTYGQPKFESKKRNDVAKTWFHMGKTAAALDQKKMEIDQQSSMNLMQQLMLQQQQNELSKGKTDMQNMLSTMASMKGDMERSMSAPPPLPNVGMPAEMPPPLPGGPPAGIPPPLPQEAPYQDVAASMGQAPPFQWG